MAATLVERDTPRMGKDGAQPTKVYVPLAANTKILKGTLVMTNASGLALPAAPATGQICWGRAEDTVDNTGGAASALSVEVRQGTFRWNNSTAGDLIVQADLGKLCYLLDNQTVAKTDGTGARSVAGRVVLVDSAGVWVKTEVAGA